MKTYLNHLEEMYDRKSFQRKTDYIKYNFSEILPRIKSDSYSALEIGPGKGEFVSLLNKKGVTNIDIVDNDKEILDYIAKQFKIRKSILSNNVELLDKKLDKYHLIIMIQVLEHLPLNIHKAIIKMLHRHLVGNGYLIIVVPNANNPLGLVERYGDLQHTTSFTEQSLRDLINYSITDDCRINIHGFEIPPYNLINIIRIIFQKILHFLLLLLLIINGGIYGRIMTPNITLVLHKLNRALL